MAATKRLPFDAELGALLPAFDLDVVMEHFNQSPTTVDQVLPAGVLHEERSFSGPDGNQLTVSIFRREPESGSTLESTGNRPGLYHIHGGGMIMGNRFANVGYSLKCVKELNVVCVAIGYRLAPTHPDPAPVEDCYAGLVWMATHAAELGVDPACIVINGQSAGAGLAAGVTLLCRDRQGPQLVGQMLFNPMLDDRNNSGSTQAFADVGIWDRACNLRGWEALLGSRRGTDDVSIYAAPIRAVDLSSLPPAIVSVGSAEIFRDETVAYAQKLWQHGVQCELHVWPGGFHSFDEIFPDAALSVMTQKAKMDWLRRLLSAFVVE